jgi:hypothetical protein
VISSAFGQKKSTILGDMVIGEIVAVSETAREITYYLGNSYFRMYRDKDAIKAHKHTVELKPDHFLAYNNLGTYWIT